MFGISDSDFEVLCTAEAQGIILKNIDKEPATLALKGVSAVLCNQIKYLGRCRTKIPHYYHALCIIPPLSYEQSSSELSSLTKRETGDNFLDLTCGLGVDTYHYSKQFRNVITIERDELLAKIARENFKRLNATNISVVNSSCEEFLEKYSCEQFDLVYVDPARRDQTKRVFLLEDCSPNIIELIPKLQKITKKVIIKLSPLFDMDEAERIFGMGVTLRAVSVADECKELCVEIDFVSQGGTKIITSCVSKDRTINESIFDKEEINKTLPQGNRAVDEYKFISIVDVALRKMRCGSGYYKKYQAEGNPLYENNVALWMYEPTNFAGRVYRIETVMEYKPRLIKELGIKTATIIIQNFDHSIEELRKRLSIKSGSGATLIFTTIRNKKYLFKSL